MDEWISVKDRVPEESGEYRLRDKNGNEFNGEFDVDVGENGGFGYWQQFYDLHTLGWVGEEWVDFDGVTHWKPLQDEEVEYWLNEGKGC